MADNEEKNVVETLDVIQALSFVQALLGTVPYTVSTEATIGKPVKESILTLEKIKEAVKPFFKEDLSKE